MSVLQRSPLPDGAIPLNASSGNVANASAAATLAVPAGKRGYITGFVLTASGATGALVVNATVTGVEGGTLTFTFTAPAGAAIAAEPLVVNFPHPLRNSGDGVDFVVTLPALGIGNTNAAANAFGYYINSERDT